MKKLTIAAIVLLSAASFRAEPNSKVEPGSIADAEKRGVGSELGRNRFVYNGESFNLLFTNGKNRLVERHRHRRGRNDVDEVSDTQIFFVREFNLFVVNEQWPDESATYLVNGDDGSDTSALFASSVRKFVTVSIFLKDCVDSREAPNRLVVLRLEKDRVDVEFAVSPTDWGPYSARWLNNNEIEVKTRDLNCDEGTRRLKFNGANWILTEK